jgi:stage V sporulation protein G
VEITEVRVKLMDEPGERLRAFCSITFDDAFVVRDLKIIEGANGPFVAMPSRKLTAHCPHCGCKNHLRANHCNQCGSRQKEMPALKDDEGRAKLYADIAHPINSSCREMIQSRVIAAFEEEKARAKMPDYVSSYDDFDGGDYDMPPRSSGMVPTQVQPAEKPRGPHRIPERHPHTDRSSADGFGEGIFN